MKLSFETRFIRFELEFGLPRLEPKKYEVLSRKRCSRMRDHLMYDISARLKQSISHDYRAE